MSVICDVQMANNIVGIVASSLSIILFILGVLGGLSVYEKIKEYIALKSVDAYYGFYKILRRQLVWLRDSLKNEQHYALADFLATQDQYNLCSPKLSNKYESCRKKILEIITTCENQTPLKKDDKIFNDNLELLIGEVLEVYYQDAPKHKLIADTSSLENITSNALSYINKMVSSIDNNKPKE